MRANLPPSSAGSGTISPAVCQQRGTCPAGLTVPPPSNSGGLVAPKSRHRRDGGGFTFIEVMVALAIFGMAGLVLASAYVNVLSAHQAALRRDDTAADRRFVREALRAEPSVDKVTSWNELTLPDDHAARWKATLTPTTVADLFDVTLEIELTDGKGNKQPTITETCRLLRPTWSQPADRETLRAAARSKLAQRTYQ